MWRRAGNMNLFKHEINVASPQTMVKITKYVREDLKKSGVASGIAVIFVLIRPRESRSMKTQIPMSREICCMGTKSFPNTGWKLPSL